MIFLYHTEYFRSKLADENFVETYCSSIKDLIKAKKETLDAQIKISLKCLKNVLNYDIAKSCIVTYF